MPRTFPPFLVGAIAISGIPFLSGFFSKDAILTAAFAQSRYFIWALGLAGAVMTAFYMFRLIFLTFYGHERIEPEAKHHLHESPKTMTVPLAILAVFSVIAGYAGLPAVLGEKADLFKRFLEPVIEPAAEGHVGSGTEWLLMLVSVVAAAIGVSIAYWFYIRDPRIAHSVVARAPRLYKLLYHKYYVDELYGAVIVHPMIKGSDWIYGRFDLGVIDGAINGSAKATGFLGRALGVLQTGFVKDYALVFLLGAVIFLGVLLF